MPQSHMVMWQSHCKSGPSCLDECEDAAAPVMTRAWAARPPAAAPALPLVVPAAPSKQCQSVSAV